MMEEKMNKILKDFLFGILILICITILEFIITLPLGEPNGEFSMEAYAYFINRELLLTAIPAGLITFIFAWFLKTNTTGVALRRSIIWTSVIFLHFLLLGIGNDNLPEIFGSVGIYLLLVCAFAGPLLCTKIRHR
jgi:hypothetical protein